MDMMLWNVGISLVVGVPGFFLREKSNEISRLSILLNKTREEVAKEYVTKSDVHNDMNRVIQRLDRLDAKLDEFMKEQRAINQ